LNSHKKKAAAQGVDVVFKENASSLDRKGGKRSKIIPSPIDTMAIPAAFGPDMLLDPFTPPDPTASRQRSLSLATNFGTKLVSSNRDGRQRTLSFASEFMNPSAANSFISKAPSPTEIANIDLFFEEMIKIPQTVPQTVLASEIADMSNDAHQPPFAIEATTMHIDAHQSHFAIDTAMPIDSHQSHFRELSYASETPSVFADDNSKCFSFASLLSPVETACDKGNFGFFSDLISPMEENNNFKLPFDNNVYRERTLSFASELQNDTDQFHSRSFSFASELQNDTDQFHSRCFSFASELPNDTDQFHSRCFSFASELLPLETCNHESISQLSALTFAPHSTPSDSVNTHIGNEFFSFDHQLSLCQSALLDNFVSNK
jgi:hypothetical protein